MKSILRLVLLAVTLSATALVRAEPASIQGILLTASSEPGQTDRRLAPYEATLRRILRIESCRFVGEDQATVNGPGAATLDLGEGHQVALDVERISGNAVHVKVRWSAGGRTLMNTGLNLPDGVPAVIGGPSTGRKGEAFAIILLRR